MLRSRIEADCRTRERRARRGLPIEVHTAGRSVVLGVVFPPYALSQRKVTRLKTSQQPDRRRQANQHSADIYVEQRSIYVAERIRQSTDSPRNDDAHYHCHQRK